MVADLHVRRPRGDLVLHDLVDGAERAVAGGELQGFDPAGRDVLYLDGERLMAAPVAGGPPRVLLASVGPTHRVELGRDGYVHFQRVGEDGRSAWRAPLGGGPAEREAPASYDFVSPPAPSGWRVAHASDYTVELIPPGGQPGDPENERLAVGSLPRSDTFTMDLEGNSILVGRGTALYRRDLATRREERLVEMPVRSNGQIALAPDGQVVYTGVSVGQDRRELITNYGERPRPR